MAGKGKPGPEAVHTSAILVKMSEETKTRLQLLAARRNDTCSGVVRWLVDREFEGWAE